MPEITHQVSSSINALMREFETITHNLANVSTAGYKRRCTAFSKSLEAQSNRARTNTGEGIDLNSALDFAQGNVTETGRPLDLALHGKGFFLIETPEGPLYTRNGVFQTNPNGQIVDSEGRLVAGEAGPITIPRGAALSQLSVSSDGSISVGGTAVGRFKLVDFKSNERRLISAGTNCFRMPDKDIKPVTAEKVAVKQGYQEASNVRIIDELVDMIMVSRLYEANMQLISAKKQTATSIVSVAMG